MNLSDLRFDHPRIYWTAFLCLGLVVVIGTFFFIPSNSFFEATGVNEAQRRIFALKNAVYWYARSIIHSSVDGPEFRTRYGSIIRYQSGSVVSSLPEGDRFEEFTLHLADVIIDSPVIAEAVIDSVRLKDARFEIYDKNKAVVWISNKPLNVALIEMGAAKPDPNPPTNIVDSVFASYYWSQFKGDSK